jgi:hypothetical protein
MQADNFGGAVHFQNAGELFQFPESKMARNP